MALPEVEFLRYLTNLIDEKIDARFQQKDQDSTTIEVTDNQVDPTEVDSPIDRDDIFVPPLQAKIEMMKKLTGVPPKDETLKQSQAQGGPAGIKSVNQNASNSLRMQDMADDGAADF